MNKPGRQYIFHTAFKRRWGVAIVRERPGWYKYGLTIWVGKFWMRYLYRRDRRYYKRAFGFFYGDEGGG